MDTRASVSSQVGRDCDLVVTLGQGPHLEALAEMRRKARILVWEPGPESAPGKPGRKRAWESRIQDPDRVEVVNSLAEVKSKLGQTLIYGPRQAKVGLLIPKPLEIPARDEVRQLKLALTCLDLRKRTNLKTVEQFGELFRANLICNFQKILQASEATAGIDALKALPALIVAAGPSLSKNLDQIKETRNKAVVICVGTVFKRLIREGIIPDVAVIIEPRDRSHQVSGEPDLDRVLLACSSVGHPAHLGQRSALNLVFHPQAWQSRLLGDLSHVPDGGNVASAAFTLAVLWGCDPIIMTGQDLAYSAGQRYAEGTGQDKKGPDPVGMTRIPGNVEDQVLAPPEMVSYLSWYEESALYLSQTRPGLGLINATAGGARIEGFTVDTVKSALSTAPELRPNGRERLIAALSGFRQDLDLVRLRLARFRREVFQLQTMAEDENTTLQDLYRSVADSPFGSCLDHLGMVESGPGAVRGQENWRGYLDQLAEMAVRLQREARAGLG